MTKYRNRPTTVYGITFDSKKEAEYYIKLRQLLNSGLIENLRIQVPYELLPAVYRTEEKQLKTKTKTVERKVQSAVHYIADFVYTDTRTGKEWVIDVKGVKTKEYRLKKKMMLALKGIEITEV